MSDIKIEQDVAAKPRKYWFVNNNKTNVFTVHGRVRPGEKVQLTMEEAQGIPNLQRATNA